MRLPLPPKKRTVDGSTDGSRGVRERSIVPRIDVVDDAMANTVGGRGKLAADVIVVGVNARDGIITRFDLMIPFLAGILFAHEELPRLAMDMKSGVIMVHANNGTGSDFRVTAFV
jgi:hypothetical protein